MLTPELINATALLVFILCVVVYAIKLRLGMKRPENAKRGLLNIFYGLWVKRMINPDETIIAVQTMRNLIMATTFLSSAMLILLGLLVKFPSGGFETLIEISPFSAAAVLRSIRF